MQEKRADIILEHVRRDLGTIVVVHGYEGKVVELQKPITGRFKGMGMGTARGLLAVPVFTFAGMSAGASEGPLGVVVGAFMGAVAGILYLPVSAISGTWTAADRAQVRSASVAIEGEFSQCPIEETLAQMFVEAAQAIASESPDGEPRIELLGAGGSSVGESLSAPDTHIALDVELIDLSGSREGWLSFDKPVSVIIQAEVRVENASHHSVRYRTQLTYHDEGRKKRYVEWGRDDAAALCQEIDHGLQQIAERFADLIFLIGELPEDAEDDEGFFSWLW
jgi:hypothetical protein